MDNIKVFIFIFIALITACTPTQRPLQNGQGYVVLPIHENHYRIEYYLKNKKLSETYWNTTAGQLCPGGFQVLYGKQFTLNFDMYVPIAGNNVNLGRQEFIQYGEVVCSGVASNTVALTDSKWKEFNFETRAIKPVSNRWLTETLKLNIGHLQDFPVVHSVSTLTKDWGKPQQQTDKNGESFFVWLKGGDSWFPNHIALLEKNNCLKLIVILPWVSSVMASALEKSMSADNLESLVALGGLPAYFYKPQAACDS